MSLRKLPVKLFESMDGRDASSEIVFVRGCEKVVLVSQGWDCDDDCESIAIYQFLHYPSNARCEDALLIRYEQDIGGCSNTHTMIETDPDTGESFPVTFRLGSEAVNLSRSRPQVTLEEQGQYILYRECGAENVCVVSKVKPNGNY